MRNPSQAPNGRNYITLSGSLRCDLVHYAATITTARSRSALARDAKNISGFVEN